MSRQTTILINLLAVFLIGFFLVWPQYQNLRRLNIEIQTKRTELQYKEEYFSNIKTISEELKKYETELSKIDSALPSGPSLPSLFNFLEKTSSQNGLIFKYVGTFSVTPLEANSGIKGIYLNIAVAGSYPAFKNFLASLEKTARLIEVDNISFSTPQKAEEPFSFNLKIKAYSY